MVSALFSYFLLSIYLVKLTLSQLSSLDSNQIISLVNSQRDEKSGLFGGDLDSTYKSVFTLKTLGEEIREIPKICKEIGYVSSRSPQLNLFLLEELLTCKNDIVKVTELNSNITSLITFYENLLMGIKSDFKIDFIGALIRLQSFQDNEKLFKESNEGTSSRTNLLSTAYGLKALSLLYNRLPEREKVIVVDDIKFIINQINNNYYHSLSSVSFNFFMINRILVSTLMVIPTVLF